MKDVTFENFLGEEHAEQYFGLDDDMSDDFVDWMCQLDPQEIIDYAETYGARRFNEGKKEATHLLTNQ